ncbi:MAG: anticodon nuclease [Arcobacter sp.]|uniref:AAA family ATPase n=1 Tax=uncultured Arcobacter sp. TaxID=165434 RepID=UPI000CC48C50|nr:AAA family ATPase [uncultured Arcobacter sp.]PLY11116.1 MAG: anticodon nuclease [Arcobacter sp.]
MGKILEEIAQDLKDSQKKVQLIYAFNGTGKTRLSRKFRLLVDPKDTEAEQEESGMKVMYYNAFTEDLFYWDNDLDADTNRKLIIRPNNFTKLALKFLKDQGLDNNIVTNFQHFTSDSITPFFNEEYTAQDKNGEDIVIKAYSEVTFSITSGDDQGLPNIKVSKAEESNFIWCVYYSLLEEVIETLNETDITNRSTDIFNQLEYVFIDDPVSSLDDNHLIELAVNISKLVKNSRSNLKFIITTHNPLFYNVISNELNNGIRNEHYVEGETNEGIEKWIYKEDKSIKYRFNKHSDGKFSLTILGRKTPFSYHLELLSEIKKAISDNQIKKYHISFMRNILEKTATFLGYPKWEKLLPENDPFANRILNLSSHSAHAGEEISEVQENDKEKLIELIEFLKTEYKFLDQSESNDTA